MVNLITTYFKTEQIGYFALKSGAIFAKSYNTTPYILKRI